MMKRAWILAFVAASAVPGCARGGGGRLPDAGDTTMTMDAGPGVGLLDSGPGGGFDAGPGGGFDAGPGGGFDAGPGGFDAGPGTSCSETPCRLVSPQCGCAAGQGCYIGSGATRICGTPGPEREGEACSGETSCQAGLLCIGPGAGQAFCSRFCNSDADCTGGPGSLCLLELGDGSGGALPGVTLCSSSCSPATNAGCPSSMGCAIFEETDPPNRVFTGCRAAGTLTEGASCLDTDECGPQLFCGADMCVRWCRVGASDCGLGQLCNSFTDPAIVGGVEYGYCL